MRLFKLLFHSPSLLLLHLSLIMVIAGGIITWLTAHNERVILHRGEPVTICGMDLELKEFETLYHPGGTIARNFQSKLIINGKETLLEINKPIKVGRWRLFQESFTPDGCSIIGLRDDCEGTITTFSGYALFFFAGILLGFKRVLKHKRKLRPGLFILMICFCCNQADAVEVISTEYADSIARTQVLYRGKVVTYSTVANDVMQKIHGSKSFRGISPVQTLLSLRTFPEQWNALPIIKTDNGYIAYNDCFDSNGYFTEEDATVAERVSIIQMLQTDNLFTETSEPKLSPLEIEAEILYNQIPFTLIIFIGLFMAAMLSFINASWGRTLAWAIAVLQILVVTFQCFASDHGPFTSTFETLQFLVSIVALMSLFIKTAQGPGLLAAACMALVAHLQHANPIVTPVMPVLHTPWLTLHVSLVMISYALFILTAAIAVTGLIIKNKKEDMRHRALNLLHPAVYLLGLGIISGSIWANEAWGRYWGWDPKETSALITFLIYAIPLHKRRPSLWWFVLPLLSVAITYFGVNMLPSLHSY